MNDLCIRDMGYFCLEDFEEIEQRGAFYVSRLKLNVHVYEQNKEVEPFKDGRVIKAIIVQRNRTGSYYESSSI
ncbi:transposase [Paenibacillus sp. FSL H7-0331]|uniref:transposase n=1 Tax=Paenibacillus sp. FSL H7-0331 TaxID=1920421 RepID=UPI00096E331C|nr:hypothetical protein BK127_24660 [Paenibacillus sp. FSL H7-0331]